MSSLADLPEVIGFFSYSREDDEAFRGTLSAVRDAIQRELGAQLGRSKSTFRLWQDKEAIAPGKLWESEIKNAVEQSVFFIPIITPRLVNSHYCQFEFEAFLARERALGRADLVFPILYIPVPALENEALWRNHPVLSAIARRQYVDWQTFRYADVHTPAMREAIARFTRKIVEALHHSWLSPEERKRQEEAEAQERAEAERRRQEAEATRHAEDEARRKRNEAEVQRLAEERVQQVAEAKRRAEEEKRQKQAEAEAARRAEEERSSREADIKQRADQERAFVAAKLSDTVSAVDAFLAAHPDSHLADEAKSLRATLVERDDAHQGTMSSDDPAVLRAFLDRYPKGKPADEVRSRLRRLEPGQPWQPSRRTVVVGGSVLGAGALAAAALVLSHHSEPAPGVQPSPAPAELVTPLTPAPTPPAPPTPPPSPPPVPQTRTSPPGPLIHTLFGHTAAVGDGIFSPDGSLIITQSYYDKSARLWDAKSGAAITTFSGVGQPVEAKFSPNSSRVLTTAQDDVPRLWDRNGRLLTPLQNAWTRQYTGSRLIRVWFSPDSSRILTTADNEKTLRLWDAKTGALLATLSGNTGTYLYGDFSPDSSRIATYSSEDEIVQLWDGKTGAAVASLKFSSGGSPKTLAQVAFSPDSSRIVTAASWEKGARLWSARTGAPLATITGSGSAVTYPKLSFSSDSSRLIVGHFGDTVLLCDGASGATLSALEASGLEEFSPDGTCIVTTVGNGDHTLRLWNTKDGSVLFTLTGHTSGILHATFSPDSSRLATVPNHLDLAFLHETADPTERIWNVKGGSPVATISDGAFKDFSLDSSRILIVSDSVAELWEARTGSKFAILSGHTAAIKSAVFSPDGRTVLTTSDDKTARLWDATVRTVTTDGH